jgi:diguanylate cyclase (GGDEF)-like protein
LRSGKILLNDKKSLIDCTVRNLSRDGACLQVESPVGIPASFDLMIEGEEASRSCRLMWQSDHRMGVAFGPSQSAARPGSEREQPHGPARAHAGGDLIRNELIGLRAALDEAKFGVVLLDAELRAQFINRAFRKMWRLADAKADSKPAFVALMYHGRDTRAYDVAEDELDAYVAERVAHVKAGNPTPRDLRLANGEVVRFQCTALPSGGRMLSYSFVTDIVRHADELEVLRTALDNVEQGIILLDAQFHAQFMNRAVRQLSGISDEQAERKPHFSQLVNGARFRNAYGVRPGELDDFISSRIALVKAGDPAPTDLRLGDGRTIRAQCAVLPGGGRMLTYTDVSDLIRHAEELERLATIDGMTNVYNSRHFLNLAQAEWGRFQRYHRPLSLLMIDVDRFKSINDRFGHDVGDRAIAHVADILQQGRRSSDIVARTGGDEFAMLLPETDPGQAGVVAERLRDAMEQCPLMVDGRSVPVTISIGLAGARLSMPGINALIKSSDEALYRAKSGGRNQTAAAAPPAVGGYEVAAE